MIIEDLHAEIKNGAKDEVTAQTEFEAQLASAEKLLEDLKQKEENLKTTKADTEEKMADEKDDKKENEDNLATNEKYRASIAPDCDWLLKSFAERRDKRSAEIDGLTTAK